jgi:hypothetical protein
MGAGNAKSIPAGNDKGLNEFAEAALAEAVKTAA